MIIEENDNGILIIFEGGNEKVTLSTTDSSPFDKIIVKSTKNGKLDISGNASLINEITGKDMITKVRFKPIESKESIIGKCDKWLDLFKKIHDILTALASNKNVLENDIRLLLNFCDLGRNNGYAIVLSLHNLYGNEWVSGIDLRINEQNDNIFKYLLANVLDYYISRQFTNQEIDLDAAINDGYFISKSTDINTRATLLSIGTYDSIVRKLIMNHNMGLLSSSLLIKTLQDEITDQTLSEEFDDQIETAEKQYEYLLELKEEFDKNKGVSLKKTKKVAKTSTKDNLPF